MTRKLVDVDRVLSEHFTAAVGGKAQRYEPAISGGDTAPEEAIMAPWRSRARTRYAAVENMLASVPFAERRVIRLVYAHGTDAMSDATDENGIPMAGKPSGLVVGKNNSPDPLGLLRVALTPTWGHGSYLRLAVGQHRALRAFAKQYPGTEPTHHAVLDFLAFEAGRGDASASMLARIRNECEEVRDHALVAFAKVQEAAIEAAKRNRDEADHVEQQAAERIHKRAQEARKSGHLPSCLKDIVGEKRDRLRAAALAVVAGAKDMVPS